MGAASWRPHLARLSVDVMGESTYATLTALAHHCPSLRALRVMALVPGYESYVTIPAVRRRRLGLGALLLARRGWVGGVGVGGGPDASATWQGLTTLFVTDLHLEIAGCVF